MAGSDTNGNIQVDVGNKKARPTARDFGSRVRAGAPAQPCRYQSSTGTESQELFKSEF